MGSIESRDCVVESHAVRWRGVVADAGEGQVAVEGPPLAREAERLERRVNAFGESGQRAAVATKAEPDDAEIAPAKRSDSEWRQLQQSEALLLLIA